MNVLRCACAATFLYTLYGSPITNPLRSDEDIGQVIPEHFDTKRTKSFHSFSPNASIVAQEVHFNIESGVSNEFSLRWSTTLGGPIYSAPVIFPSGVNGNKQIFVNTFYQYAEQIDSDGFKSWGWPLSFEDSSFQGSPMVYDVDGDGNIDMGMVDKNANMFWVRIGESGEYLEDYHVQVPKLRVKRDWAAGLDPAFVDTYVQLSMFDRSQPQQEGAGGAGRGGAMRTARLDDLQAVPKADATRRRRLSVEQPDEAEDHGEEGGGLVEDSGENDNVVPDFGEELTDDFVRLEAERMQGAQLMYGAAPEGEEGMEGMEGKPSEGDAPASVQDILSADTTDGLEEPTGPDGTYEYAYRAAPLRAHGGHGTGYGAGAYAAGSVGVNESDYVMVDAHVLSSPTLADINGDGHMEVGGAVYYAVLFSVLTCGALPLS
jgi:hypothetical protein